MELLIARNPDPNSTLPYLLRLPIGDGLVFRTKGTWPRTSALYCHPVPTAEWPDQPDIVERVALRSCARRGAAIDVVADRAREQRSQVVFTKARGREMVFWQSPRTRKQARPDVRLPSARAAGIVELEIWSTLMSSMRTASPDSRSARCAEASVVGITPLASAAGLSLLSNASLWLTSFPA